jgi:hypothetical protein
MQVKQTATNVAIVVASFLGALVVAIYAARPFVFQVREGFNEGTPVQMLVFTFVFISAFALFVISGSCLVKRHHRKSSNSN